MRRSPSTRSVSSVTTQRLPQTAPLSSVDGAVREGVVGLFRVTRSLEKQQQLVVPGRLAGLQHAARCAARCPARSPPTPRATAGRAPTDAWRPASSRRRRRCKRTSGPVPSPSTSRTATSAGRARPSAGSAASDSAGPSGVADQSSARISAAISPSTANGSSSGVGFMQQRLAMTWMNYSKSLRRWARLRCHSCRGPRLAASDSANKVRA